MLEFVNNINNYYNRVLDFDMSNLYKKILESIKLVENIEIIYVRSLLYNAL